MINVIGKYPDTSELLAIDSVHYHSYHKTEREGRKIAHITLMPNDVCDLEASLSKIIAVLQNKVGLDKTLAPAAVTENSPSKNQPLENSNQAETAAAAKDNANGKTKPTAKAVK